MANPHTTSNPKSTQVSDSQELETALSFHLNEIDKATDHMRQWALTLSQADYKALATYLYWIRTDLSNEIIARMIGFDKPKKLFELVDPRYPLPIDCMFCGQEKYIHLRSRNSKRRLDRNPRQREMSETFYGLIKSDQWQHVVSDYVEGTSYRFNSYKVLGLENYQFDSYMYWFLPRPEWYEHRSNEDFVGVCDECNEYIHRVIDNVVEQRKAEIKRERSLPYSEYLKTAHWNEVRINAIHLAQRSCQVCNASGVQLDVHHRNYANLGNESSDDLIVLCRDCHSTFHKAGKVKSTWQGVWWNG